MVVTVITMRVMQVTVNEVIDVVAVWNRFMPASRTVNMIRFMTTALVRRGARIRIRFAHFDTVLDHASILCNVMQLTVMKIIDMVAVLNPGVSAIGTMLVVVVGVDVGHRSFSESTETKSGVFHCMHDAIGHQSRNVPISQAVINMLAVTFRRHDPLAL